MRRILFIFLGVSITISLFAQRHSRAKISNVELEVAGDDIIVTYDILNSDQNREHRVELVFIDENLSYVYPRNIEGDVGSKVSGGKNKKAVWHITKDLKILNMQLRPEILLDEQRNEFNGGTSNALLSLVVPGLGDYFVADHRQVRFKPYFRTAGALGFVTLGVIAHKKKYKDSYTITHQEYLWRERRTITKKTTVDGGWNYWLFKNDDAIFIGIGTAIWLFDIFWVAGKGHKNQNLPQNSYLLHKTASNFSVGGSDGVWQLKYTISF